jgi:hypothetical protein
MSHENNSVEKVQGNPKKSPEYLEWKNRIVDEYKNRGINISADEEYFILNLKDRDGKPYQIKMHAWEEIPVVREKNRQDIGDKPPTVPVTDIIEAEVLYASNHSIEEKSLPTSELLDRLRAEKNKNLKK